MRFIEFVLQNSPLLEMSNIKWSNFNDKQSIEKKVHILLELLSFKRVSSSAKVNFLI
ncbi:hypothetical protein ZOSMA_309G00100 [Zostera marina]|uniref:FBD domain-containing protein n=1 Tax=Zostera marina TaxID=29655 RepID=A0A0K9PA61_ZOSMR|nr:hypothetical protein ZOSMA_309G00100 [Zostera marina]